MPGFFTPRIPPALLWPPGSSQSLSYYDTAPLKATLERLVDFDRINDGRCGSASARSASPRAISAISTTIQEARQEDRARAHHGLRRAAAGLPAVEIDGEHYWDGGIVSNTPLDYVLDEEFDRDLLVFQVDLFAHAAPLPKTLLEAAEREKDIRYSSRTRMNTDANMQLHNARKAMRDLLNQLPEELQARSRRSSSCARPPRRTRSPSCT